MTDKVIYIMFLGRDFFYMLTQKYAELKDTSNQKTIQAVTKRASPQDAAIHNLR